METTEPECGAEMHGCVCIEPMSHPLGVHRCNDGRDPERVCKAQWTGGHGNNNLDIKVWPTGETTREERALTLVREIKDALHEGEDVAGESLLDDFRPVGSTTDGSVVLCIREPHSDAEAIAWMNLMHASPLPVDWELAAKDEVDDMERPLIEACTLYPNRRHILVRL